MEKNTKEHIVDTAIDSFWRNGYHGVNMNELSRAAGVNKATIYQHFASKEDLAVAAVKHSAQMSTEYAYQSTFGATDDPQKRIEGIYQKVYQLQNSLFDKEGKSPGCPFVNIGLEMAMTSDLIRDAVADFMDSLRPFYSRIIQSLWADAPTKHPDDREALVSALIANMNGALVAAKLENRPEAVLDGQARALKLLGICEHNSPSVE